MISVILTFTSHLIIVLSRFLVSNTRFRKVARSPARILLLHHPVRVNSSFVACKMYTRLQLFPFHIERGYNADVPWMRRHPAIFLEQFVAKFHQWMGEGGNHVSGYAYCCFKDEFLRLFVRLQAISPRPVSGGYTRPESVSIRPTPFVRNNPRTSATARIAAVGLWVLPFEIKRFAQGELPEARNCKTLTHFGIVYVKHQQPGRQTRSDTHEIWLDTLLGLRRVSGYRFVGNEITGCLSIAFAQQRRCDARGRDTSRFVAGPLHANPGIVSREANAGIISPRKIDQKSIFNYIFHTCYFSIPVNKCAMPKTLQPRGTQ